MKSLLFSLAISSLLSCGGINIGKKDSEKTTEQNTKQKEKTLFLSSDEKASLQERLEAKGHKSRVKSEIDGSAYQIDTYLWPNLSGLQIASSESSCEGLTSYKMTYTDGSSESFCYEGKRLPEFLKIVISGPGRSDIFEKLAVADLVEKDQPHVMGPGDPTPLDVVPHSLQLDANASKISINIENADWIQYLILPHGFIKL